MEKEVDALLDVVIPLPESLSGFKDEIRDTFKKGWIVTNQNKLRLRDSGGVESHCYPLNLKRYLNPDWRNIVFQINLEQLPDYIHRNRLPRVGMVFVTYEELRDDIRIDTVYYDQPVETLEYNSGSHQKPAGNAFQEVWTPPFLFIDKRFEYMEYLEEDYYDWLAKALPYRRLDFLQIGGNMTSCQSFWQENQDQFVAQMTHLSWLYDMGEITLYYSVERGFYVQTHSH